MERRLAAILATDMADYSRLMEADESGIIFRQKAHRRELIDPEIERHRGRIVKTTDNIQYVVVQTSVKTTDNIQYVVVQTQSCSRLLTLPLARGL